MDLGNYASTNKKPQGKSNLDLPKAGGFTPQLTR